MDSSRDFYGIKCQSRLASIGSYGRTWPGCAHQTPPSPHRRIVRQATRQPRHYAWRLRPGRSGLTQAAASQTIRGTSPVDCQGDCHAVFHSREMRVVALLYDAVAASGVAGPRTRVAPRPSSYRLVAGAMNAPWTACPTG